MHIEKNMFDNIFNTILNVPGKIKDNMKSWAELNVICRRPQLAKDVGTGKYPKASYVLDKDSKSLLYEWVKKLRFPDGFMSNIGRCVDASGRQMYGIKSHDCHVFM